MTESPGGRTPSTGGADQKRIGRLVVGVLALALSIGYLLQSVSMPQGTLDSPGPGMFPVGVGIAAIVISLVVVVEGLVGAGAKGSLELPVGFERRQVLIFMGTLVGFILILPLAGQYLAASIYVVATLKFLGRLSWIRSIILGVLIGAGVSLLFAEVLEIPLPAGLF